MEGILQPRRPLTTSKNCSRSHAQTIATRFDMPTRITGFLGIPKQSYTTQKRPEPRKDGEQERRGPTFPNKTGCLLIFGGSDYYARH